ncbi:MAG TPA: PhzF family phenazine biosynthesis protein [Chitinophagaceae bacterium]
MKLTLYQVDAFADQLFSGNPAAVIPLDQWIDDVLMQKIAMENNLAETVFFVKKGADFDIRWFTPELEINLCGHATLASAYVLYNILGYDKPGISFHSKSGPLRISRDGEIINLDFPSWKPERVDDYPAALLDSLGNPEIAGIYKYRDYLVELNNEDAVRNCNPDFSLMKKAGGMVMITAPGKQVDFVSRFFAPTAGIDEDPVTGSAHSQLIPFWSYKLGKDKLRAKQLSKRGGDLYCEQKGDRVIMGGKCVFYMKGEIHL